MRVRPEATPAAHSQEHGAEPDGMWQDRQRARLYVSGSDADCAPSWALDLGCSDGDIYVLNINRLLSEVCEVRG